MKFPLPRKECFFSLAYSLFLGLVLLTSLRDWLITPSQMQETKQHAFITFASILLISPFILGPLFIHQWRTLSEYGLVVFGEFADVNVSMTPQQKVTIFPVEGIAGKALLIALKSSLKNPNHKNPRSFRLWRVPPQPEISFRIKLYGINEKGKSELVNLIVQDEEDDGDEQTPFSRSETIIPIEKEFFQYELQIGVEDTENLVLRDEKTTVHLHVRIQVLLPTRKFRFYREVEINSARGQVVQIANSQVD